MNKFLRLARQWRDFAAKKIHPASLPLRIWIDVTSRCNLACPACLGRTLPAQARRDMEDYLLASLCEQAGAMGALVNLFHRGEPLMRPDLPLWAARFKRAGAGVRIHTNATRMDATAAAGLVAAKVDFITLSIDSLDPAAYAAARPGATLQQALAGAELLLKAKRLAGRNKPQVSLLLMGPRAAGPEATARLDRLKSLGLDRVIHRRPHNWGGGLAAPPAHPITGACTFPWYGPAVLADGRVAPCPQDFFGQMDLGNAGEASLAQIWQGKELASLRRAHRDGDLSSHPVCLACDRIRRPTFLGIPREHLGNFLREY